MRINLLKSQIQRIVFRKSNRYIIGQVVESKEAKDRVLCSVNSKELLKYGLKNKNSVKNLSCSYLSGLLFGKKIKDKKIKNEFILDSGILKSTPQNKIYAFIKGLKEAGIKIPVDEKMLPKEERIYSKLEKEEIEKIKKDIEK